MKLIKIIPKQNTSFVFGDGSQENISEFFHSDSLASAIISSAKSYGINVDYKNFPSITSLFYGIKDTYFIIKPLPINLAKIFENERKINKEIKWISIKAYKNLLKEEKNFKKVGKHILVSEGEEEITEELFSINTVTKNKVSRKTQSVEKDDGLFSITSLKPNKGVFFYFLVEELNEKFEKAISSLKYTGLGGNRSSGYGQIEDIEIIEASSDFKEVISKNSDTYTNLSVVFFKSVQEFEKVKSYKQFISRGFIGGKIWNHRRKTIIGIQEGAEIQGKIEGKILDGLAPEGLNIEVVRIGKAFLIPTTNGDNNE